jgi:hypothetical protein
VLPNGLEALAEVGEGGDFAERSFNAPHAAGEQRVRSRRAVP